MMRIGHGFDVHRFDLSSSGPVEIKLGGVAISSPYSLIAHSDGDVLLHALCDALLGALGKGDIGEHFPDTDERFKGADSRTLLAAVMALVHEENFQLANADITVVAEVPKITPAKAAMREQIAADAGVDVGQINIKATTVEKLGAIGRKEGIACHAVVLLVGVN